MSRFVFLLASALVSAATMASTDIQGIYSGLKVTGAHPYSDNCEVRVEPSRSGEPNLVDIAVQTSDYTSPLMWYDFDLTAGHYQRDNSRSGFIDINIENGVLESVMIQYKLMPTTDYVNLSTVHAFCDRMNRKSI